MIRRGLALCLLALVLFPCTAPFQTWRTGRELGVAFPGAALLLPSVSSVGESSVAPPPRVRTTVADAPALVKIVALDPEIVQETPRPVTNRHDDSDRLAPDRPYWPRLTVLRV
ncbi:MAG: hypothetical protein AB7F99_07645 [Vicinamibacterales bacterium]